MKPILILALALSAFTPAFAGGDCCQPKAACCQPAQTCCRDEKVEAAKPQQPEAVVYESNSKAPVAPPVAQKAVPAEVTNPAEAQDCCFPGSPCCEEGSSCCTSG
jgi:hypothetical protein